MNTTILDTTTVRRWKRYPSLVPSDVEWLNDIPAHWGTKPLKFVTQFTNGDSFNSGDWAEEGIPIIRIENLNGGDNFNYSKREVDTRYHVRKGDLLFAWSGNRGTSFGPFHWERDGLHYLNQHIFRLDGFDLDRRWFYWLLKGVTAYVEKQAHGIIGLVHITRPELGSVKVPMVPEVEQQSIAAFLDRETTRIDALIGHKERLIELLEEKRQAVISHAVTRGLDPNVLLKGSGLAGLDSVPSHWTITRLKYATASVTVGVVVTPSKYYVDEGVPALRGANVREGRILEDDLVYFSPESNQLLAKSMLRTGDLVAVRTGQPGTTAVVSEKFNNANCIDLILIRRSPHFDSRFLCYLANSWVAKAQYEEGADGAIQQHFNIETAKNMMIFLPPLKEQAQIVRYLDQRTAELSLLMCRVRYGIARLQEYRTALISAAVTGQIDVRGEV